MKYRDTPHDSKWVLTWSSCFVACFIIRSCTPSLLSPSLSLHPSCLSHTSLIAVLIHFLHCFYFIFFSNYAAICHCRLLDVHFKPLTHSMLGVDGQCLSGHVLACKLLVVQSCPCMGVFLFLMPSGGSAFGCWVQEHYSKKHTSTKVEESQTFQVMFNMSYIIVSCATHFVFVLSACQNNC